MSISAMKQALEALDSDNPDIQLRAATALRTAIEQAEDAVAAEREACANLLLNVDLSSMDADHRLQSWTATVLLNFSAAIRARGEQ
jgi:formate dehydrogenase maturation protein FdhE